MSTSRQWTLQSSSYLTYRLHWIQITPTSSTKLLTSFPGTHRLLGFSSYFSGSCSLLGSWLLNVGVPTLLSSLAALISSMTSYSLIAVSPLHTGIPHVHPGPEVLLNSRFAYLRLWHLYCILNRHFKLHLSKTELSIFPNPAPPPSSSF